MERHDAALYLDECCPLGASKALRQAGYDVTNAHEQSRLQLSDEAQLEFCTAEDRILVSHNVGDFCRLHQAWFDAGREHPGVLLGVGADPGDIMRRVVYALGQTTREAVRNNRIFF